MGESEVGEDEGEEVGFVEIGLREGLLDGLLDGLVDGDCEVLRGKISTERSIVRYLEQDSDFVERRTVEGQKLQ